MIRLEAMCAIISIYKNLIKQCNCPQAEDTVEEISLVYSQLNA